MDEDALNTSIRQFLKIFREARNVSRKGGVHADSRLNPAKASLPAKAAFTLRAST
jgi:hypothetical protein